MHGRVNRKGSISSAEFVVLLELSTKTTCYHIDTSQTRQQRVSAIQNCDELHDWVLGICCLETEAISRFAHPGDQWCHGRVCGKCARCAQSPIPIECKDIVLSILRALQQFSRRWSWANILKLLCAKTRGKKSAFVKAVLAEVRNSVQFYQCLSISRLT